MAKLGKVSGRTSKQTKSKLQPKSTVILKNKRDKNKDLKNKLKKVKANFKSDTIETKSIIKSKKDVKNEDKKQKYSSMSVDEFLNLDFQKSDDEKDNEIDDFSEENKWLSLSDAENATSSDDDKQDALDSDSEEETSKDELKTHKKSLEKLKTTDPEFYTFLQENDKKLLNFNVSDSENEKSDDEEKTDEQLHKPAQLEVASDESDFEADDEKKSKKNVKDDRRITLNLLKQWHDGLRTDKTCNTITCVIKAFHAALLTVSSDEEKNSYSEYKVEGSAVFNGVIQLCVLELQPAVRRFLKIPQGSKQPPHKFKRFVKIKIQLRSYLNDLLKLLGGVTSANILTVLLKHLHHMSPMIVSYSHITKSLLKRLINLWSTSDESVRVVAFLCILRITNNERSKYLDYVLKTMYMSFVKNCKFVSPKTLPGINFMRRSLKEMFTLDLNASYQHVFLYIRQLAIHLRNAITLKKKENIQAVYNWQFVNSLSLWADLLTATYNKPQLEPLIYPLVQITLGTVKLVPTAQYYPLRFHCLEILLTLSKETGIYIPILPFLYEIFTSFDFSKKHKKVSMKPLQFTCILRLSKSQLSENGFKDAVIESLYGSLLEYLACHSYMVAFPDLVLPLTMEIRKFLKSCAVANYCKKFKQLLEKIEENCRFIEKERKTISISLSDTKAISGWENSVKNKGTPLITYYENWEKLHQLQKSKRATQNDEIGDYNFPTIKKIKKRSTNTETSNEPVDLFPSESEDDDMEFVKKPVATSKRKRKGNKTRKEPSVQNDSDDNTADIVTDVKASDW